MSVKCPREVFLCPESRLSSQRKAPFSGDNKQIGNFSSCPQDKIASPFCKAGQQGSPRSRHSASQPSSTAHQHHLSQGSPCHLWRDAPALYGLCPSRDHLLARMSHVGCPNRKGVWEMQENVGVSFEQGLFFPLNTDLPLSTLNMARELCLGISRVIKGVRTRPPFEKQTFREASALDRPQQADPESLTGPSKSHLFKADVLLRYLKPRLQRRVNPERAEWAKFQGLEKQ